MESKKKYHSITFRIDKKDKEELSALAAKDQRSLSNYIRQVVEESLGKKTIRA